MPAYPYTSSPRDILEHTRAIDAHVAAGGIARIRSTFAEYDATGWIAFKARELDRRINEKGCIERGEPAARRDALALRDWHERRIRLPRRFQCPDVQARLSHLLPVEDD